MSPAILWALLKVGTFALVTWQGGDADCVVVSPGVAVCETSCDALIEPELWVGDGEFSDSDGEESETITYAACTPRGRLVLGFEEN